MIRGYIDWDRWGRKPKSVSTLDLAILSNLANYSTEEINQMLIDAFPIRSPLRQNSFIHDNTLGVDYCIFPIDDDHALVSFAGTKSFLNIDALTDLNLFLGAIPFVGQAAIANALVKDLPYQSLIITGYSLGGYLGSDVRLSQKDKVVECITFNAPGRGLLNTGGQIFGPKDTRITNYSAIGDQVSRAGVQPGNVISVVIAADAESWAVFGKHDIQYIIDALILAKAGSPGGASHGDSW